MSAAPELRNRCVNLNFVAHKADNGGGGERQMWQPQIVVGNMLLSLLLLLPLLLQLPQK